MGWPLPQSGNALPTRITKFVPAEVFELVLSGSLRFGSLEEYRACEAAEKRLSDRRDGSSSHYVKGDLINESFTLGGNFINVTAIGSRKAAVTLEKTEDALIFCASCGDYSPDLHRRFIEAGNGSCTHYVVFDLEGFLKASKELSLLVAPQGWGHAAPVVYAEKDHEVTLREIEELSNRPVKSEAERRSLVCKSVFVKSPMFEYEQEFRVALMRIQGDRDSFRKALLTANLPDEVQGLFKNAAIGSGHI